MSENEFETKENKIKPRIKLNHNVYNTGFLVCLSQFGGLLLLTELGHAVWNHW